MIKRTRGNKTGVIIPLFTRTLHEDGTTSVEPFTPSSDDAVVVTLEAARKYNYTPIIGENCVIFDLSGAEVAGIYSLTVNISRADGSRLRYFTRGALELTELSSESGDDETAEFTVTSVELDAAWFFFAKGDTGDPGRGIVSVEKTATSGLVDTYTITYTDETTSTFSVVNGRDGLNGRGITTIKKISSADLVDTYQIKYTDGTSSLFNVANGAPGRGIVNITKDSTEGLEDTYEITYTDGTNSFFTVTNGKKGDTGDPGNGIAKLEKTATVGLVDTYRITFTNGTIFYFDVTNGADGVSVQSITKTSTEGLVDTYTITLSNGTTTTFTVTNGRDGMQRVELETTGDDIHVKGTTTPLTFAEVLALVEDTTKFVTLYDGINLYLPAYDDQGGAVIFTSSFIQNSQPQITRVAINNAGQIKYESATMEFANLKTDNLNNEGSEQWRTYPTTHAVNEALNDKANKDGYYEQMVVGGAENLIGEGNTIEENFYRKTYDNTIEDAEATIKSLKGNTIKINQLADGDFTKGVMPSTDHLHGRYSYTYTNGYAERVTTTSWQAGVNYIYGSYNIGVITNHKYLAIVNAYGTCLMSWNYFGYKQDLYLEEQWKNYSAIGIYTGQSGSHYFQNRYDGVVRIKYSRLIDLTAIFGDNVPSSIVDADTFAQYYGYSTFDEIPQEFLEYSEDGKLRSFTAQGIKTTDTSGDEHTHNFYIANIKDSEGNKLFPYGLLSAGSIYDEITPTKAIKRVGVVDLGNLSYSSSGTTSSRKGWCTSLPLLSVPVGYNDVVNAVAVGFTAVSQGKTWTPRDMVYNKNNSMFTFFVNPNEYTNATSFKQAMQGQNLYYELAEPIEVDLTEYNANFLAYREGKAELIGASTPMKASVAYGRNYANLVEQSEQKIKELEAKNPLRDLFVSAGAVYNSNTGYYELNGLTDITEEQMMVIYNETNQFLQNVSNMAGVYADRKFRTNFLSSKRDSTISRLRTSWTDAFRDNTRLEILNLNEYSPTNTAYWFAPTATSSCFSYCYNIKAIIGHINLGSVSNTNNMFSKCNNLENVLLYNLKVSISFADSPNLSKESILFMINNEAATSAITITLHPTAKAMADADSEIQTALSNHPNISLA